MSPESKQTYRLDTGEYQTVITNRWGDVVVGMALTARRSEQTAVLNMEEMITIRAARTGVQI